MRYFKITYYLAFVLIISLASSCSSDDDTNPSAPEGSQLEFAEIDFTNSLGINTAYKGLAAYEIIFNGTFVNALNGIEVQIEGTLKVNFPENVEQY
ncbi:hypothetical protein [Psychroflexus halocasei]|uniref:Uncharacterized protein n=1 Tax=Psychroflexus halocasei TaxID=908615 RepID=A0A1H4AGW0_9FLAO|nr:hypothetical protein [Psychroflexus halocasei]SEA35185.1 hypothetical protein SAMN05421540_10532 [Psychroflexus halocasei]